MNDNVGKTERIAVLAAAAHAHLLTAVAAGELRDNQVPGALDIQAALLAALLDLGYVLDSLKEIAATYDAGFNAGEAATRKQIAPAGVADYERLLASGHAGLAGTIATQLAKHLDIAADLIAAAVLTAGWTTGKDSTTEYVGKDATATVAELRAEVSNGHTFAPAPAMHDNWCGLFHGDPACTCDTGRAVARGHISGCASEIGRPCNCAIEAE